MVASKTPFQHDSEAKNLYCVPWIARWEARQQSSSDTNNISGETAKRESSDIDFLTMLEELEFR